MRFNMPISLASTLLLLVLSSIYQIGYVRCTTYYFSSSVGNDDMRITCTDPASPCASFARLNKIIDGSPGLYAGDNVLFKRGDTFHGIVSTLSAVMGNASHPITFSSYGGPEDREKPILSGTTIVAGFEPSSRCYGCVSLTLPSYYDYISSISNVFVGGVKMPWSRQPNLNTSTSTGNYFTISGTPNLTSITSTSLRDPSGTWTGVTVRIRPNQWLVLTAVITSHTFDPQTNISSFTFTPGPANGVTIDPDGDWPFFFENNVLAIDLPGEWAYEAATKTIIMIPSNDDVVTNTTLVELATSPFTFWLTGSSYITFYDLHFFGHSDSAIVGASCSHLLIADCVFNDQELIGIYFTGVNDSTIYNNTFYNMQNAGIKGEGNNRVVVEFNSVSSVSLVPGHQPSYMGSCIFIDGNNIIVRRNNVSYCGYNGIHFTNSMDGLVERNYVHHSNQVLYDGACVYIWGPLSINMTVQNNIVGDQYPPPSYGFLPASQHYPICRGIYLDNFASYCNVLQNTVFRTIGAGLYENSGYHLWRDNLVVSGDLEPIIFTLEMLDNIVVGSRFVNNTLYATSDLPFIEEWSLVHNTTSMQATYLSQRYCNYYGTGTYRFLADNRPMDLNEWLAIGRDINFTLCNTDGNRFIVRDNTSIMINEHVAINPSDYLQIVSIPPGFIFVDYDRWGPYLCNVTLQPYSSMLLITNGTQSPHNCDFTTTTTSPLSSTVLTSSYSSSSSAMSTSSSAFMISSSSRSSSSSAQTTTSLVISSSTSSSTASTSSTSSRSTSTITSSTSSSLSSSPSSTSMSSTPTISTSRTTTTTTSQSSSLFIMPYLFLVLIVLIY
eukprot:TRINITY_DN4680_c3_g1_i2.p1 TRINITY_DN4680_c3_g1~~TRINITY_DN4680_c3_g1_i2.p1  ORF type:complete len:834 (-),score=126.43 TRINITY_DN4680_c3_g1_i2:17-2518(-)